MEDLRQPGRNFSAQLSARRRPERRATTRILGSKPGAYGAGLLYHGGMIATVRALTGRPPRAYIGDSTRPEVVRTRSLARPIWKPRAS